MDRQAFRARQEIEQLFEPDFDALGAPTPRALEQISVHDDPTTNPPSPLANGGPSSNVLIRRILEQLEGTWTFDPTPYVIALIDSIGLYSGIGSDRESAWMIVEDVETIASDYQRHFIECMAEELMGSGVDWVEAIASARRQFLRAHGLMTAARVELVRKELVLRFGGLCSRTRREFRNATRN